MSPRSANTDTSKRPGDNPVTLATPLRDLKAIHARSRAGLEALGLTNLGRLIAHLPMRHEMLEEETPIASLEPDRIGSARGEVSATRVVMTRPRPRFEAVLCDEDERLDLVWFNQTFLRDRIKAGTRLRVQGNVRVHGPGLQMINPTFEILAAEEPPRQHARLRPVYPASEAIKSAAIERSILATLDLALPLLEDHLPETLRRERELIGLAQAYERMHRPASEQEVAQARRRLAYDELLLLQLGVQLKRSQWRRRLCAPALPLEPAIDRRIRARLPFALTQAQERVVAEIAADLALPTPMNRLLQGDVGTGKTAVAAFAMLTAAAHGHQAALIAPTEILAEQHHAALSRLLDQSQVRVGLLTGSLSDSQHAALAEQLRDGSTQLVVATHALLDPSIAFRSLALTIIDEQHRFGVEQRSALRGRAAASLAPPGSDALPTPHVLVMTATPIPRTLALTWFGDLDVSTLDAPPPGRVPVRTRLVGAQSRPDVYAFVKDRLARGEQCMIVAPTIDSSGSVDEDDVPASDLPAPMSGVRELAAELEAGPLQGFTVAALHARLPRASRAAIMERFRNGTVHALVATTVIEVGVDVPNATVMVIEHADRFGVAQLHQLRGRVGRGTKGGVCVLVSDAPPLGEQTQSPTRQRLELVASTTDGFRLAEGDWALRGSGDFFSTRQSGVSPLQVADLVRDRELLEMARRDARAWIEQSPELDRPQDALARRRLVKTFGKSLGLVLVG